MPFLLAVLTLFGCSTVQPASSPTPVVVPGPTPVPVPGPTSTGVLQAATDFDGDGIADLLTIDSQLVLHSGTATGELAPALVVRDAADLVRGTGDVDGDGCPEVVAPAGDQLRVWACGALPVAPLLPELPIPGVLEVVGAADLGSTGAPEILTRNIDGSLDIWTATANGDYEEVAHSIHNEALFATADIDGDGVVELNTQGLDSVARVYRWVP